MFRWIAAACILFSNVKYRILLRSLIQFKEMENVPNRVQNDQISRPAEPIVSSRPGKAENNTISQIVQCNDRVVVKKILSGEYTEAEKLLQGLQESMKTANYGDNRRVEYVHQATCHYNLACIYQKIWKNQECCTHIERSIQYQELEISMCKNELERISRKIELIRCYLQYCAVLSQLGRHQKSLEVSKRIISAQKEIFSKCKRFCQDNLNAHPSVENYGLGTVGFDKVLINDAYQKLCYLAEIPEADQVLSSYRESYQAISQTIYYWKSIPENNEKMMRKELRLQGNLTPVRNVLGVSKNDEWIDSFNIGSVMMMRPKHIEDYTRSDLLYILSNKCLLEQIFYTSIGYFTIATEIRFKEVENELKGLKANQKLIKLSQNNFAKICKVYHLKAIQLAGKYVSTSSQYINHLILSFNKNYKSAMDPIHEESVIINDSFLDRPPQTEYMTSPQTPTDQLRTPSIHGMPVHSKISRSKNKKPFNRKKNQSVSDHDDQRSPDFHRPIIREGDVREMRSQTKSNTSGHIMRRTERVRSEQSRPKLSEEIKREEIKTFTFKFVKEVKESSIPPTRKKGTKKTLTTSSKKLIKRI